VRANYRVTTEPARVTIGGSSYGGLAAGYAALTHPELFGNVVSLSGSYWWAPDNAPADHEWLTAQIRPAQSTSPRFYLDVGLYETIGLKAGGPNQIEANSRFRDTLQANGYAVTYAEFVGGHDYFCWRGTLADGLLALAEQCHAAR
jgi:enterochelin esterase family protein